MECGICSFQDEKSKLLFSTRKKQERIPFAFFKAEKSKLLFSNPKKASAVFLLLFSRGRCCRMIVVFGVDSRVWESRREEVQRRRYE